MSNYKSMAHSIREILEGKQVDPNQSDLDKLKKVAKVEDESDAEEKLDFPQMKELQETFENSFKKNEKQQCLYAEPLNPVQAQHV